MFTTFYYTFTILPFKICFENVVNVALLIIHDIDVIYIYIYILIYRGKFYDLIFTWLPQR